MNNITYLDVLSMKTQKSSRWPHCLLLFLIFFISPFAFAQFPAPYCDVDGYSVEEITKIEFAGVEIENTDDSSFLLDYTTEIAEVVAGQSYTITVQGNTYGDENDFYAFIDWNHNGFLDDANEIYYIGRLEDSDGDDGQSVSLSIAVPTTAVAGETRIRISKTWIYEGFEVNPDPCWISGYDDFWEEYDDSFGQAIDFTLNVDSDNEAPQPGESCEIEVKLVFPEFGDVTTWKLLDGGGRAVLSGGPYSSWTYENFTITQSYTGSNPPYSLQITVNDLIYESCDNEVNYLVTVGGAVDISGTVSACEELVSETFLIGPCPTCGPPTRLTKTNITNTGFKLNWTSSGDQFEIEYGPVGFVQGSAAGTIIQNITSTSYTFTNLTNSQAYEFYVRRICADIEEESDWTGPLVFDEMLTTPSPWHEDFSGGQVYPLGWTPLTGATWSFTPVTTDHGNSIHTTLYDEWFFGGVLTGGFSTITVGPILYGDTFSLDYLLTDGDGAPAYEDLGHFTVEFSTDFGQSYSTIETINGDGTSGWQSFTYDLEDYVGQYLKIRIKANVEDIFVDFNVAFDNFDISGGVPCDEVTSAEVEVTEEETVLHIESEGTTFEIEYGLAGFARGAGITKTNVTSPYTFSNLTADTQYEVYVRALPCGAWFGPVAFETLPLRTQTITVEDLTKVYGDIPFVHGASDSDLELSYAVADETVAKFENGKLTIKGVGTTTVTASQAGNNVYLPAEEVTFTLTVTKAMLTITADPNQSKRYGSEDPIYTYTATGFKYADTVALLTGNLARELGEEMGTYALTQGNLNGGRNYNITFISAEFQIIQAELVVRAHQQTKEYGEVDPILTYEVTGLLNNDTEAEVLRGTLMRIAGENVGAYAISQGNLDVLGANYELVFHGSELNITPAALRVIPDANQQKVYGQLDPVFTFTVTGLKFNDTAATALSGRLGRQIGENVGLYTYDLGTLQALSGNYTLTVETLEKLKITPAPLEIIVRENQFKNYGDADPMFMFNAIGLQRGDQPIQVTAGRLARVAGEEIGLYAINQGTLTVRANYELVSFTSADFEIKQSPISGLSLPDRIYIYDGQVKALQVEGNIRPEAVITYTNNNKTEVGIYAVKATVDYGPAFEVITLNGTLRIEKANQEIDFETVTTVVIEDTPTLQLTASASSGLPVSYRINDAIDQTIATVSEGGLVQFLRPGFVSITAYQAGNENYSPAVPVTRTIEVTSRAVGIDNLIIDGISYGKPEKEVYVVIGCDHAQDQVVIEVQVADGVVVSPSNYITVSTKEYGLYEQVITVTSPRGTEQETYKIYIEKRIATDRIVYQKYNNVLLVNNNKQTNGGYVFKGYEWFKNGVSIGDQQAYSAGNNVGDVLEVGAEYHVVLTLHNGKKVVSCPIYIENKATADWGVYPNPVQKNQVLHLRLNDNKQQAVSYVIYNVIGQTIQQGSFVEGTTDKQIEILSTVAAGSYILVLKGNDTQQSVQFIVKE
ncbi:T9SS type A sorting domain-containing protein [Myroides sp. 1354]|nr:T9SS type A sorting domain-containing protein [Myroides sp. R163-1]MDM1055145.1 T9SS type A sorting domain-containing protein [Myroides sp. 1354]MDM1068442.1 T9SS type A sorting domain-containing protein [Myroides sp. 1372]